MAVVAGRAEELRRRGGGRRRREGREEGVAWRRVRVGRYAIFSFGGRHRRCWPGRLTGGDGEEDDAWVRHETRLCVTRFTSPFVWFRV